MKNLFSKLTDQLIRILFVSILFIAGILFIRFMIPPQLKNPEEQKAATLQRETAKVVKYAGSVVCGECHDDIDSLKKNGYHRNLSCETCHGPSQNHADDPTGIKPMKPAGRKFCPVCHAYNASRPMGFPQIIPVIHNPLEPCVNCHQPHDPKPPVTPKECVACHGGIGRTKAISHHVELECVVCHVTPVGHKITPRTIMPSKPANREFCGKCHGSKSPNPRAPKVDIASHGEKYLCWQCHYPHMPEVE